VFKEERFPENKILKMYSGKGILNSKNGVRIKFEGCVVIGLFLRAHS